MMKTAIAALLLLSAVPANAHGQYQHDHGQSQAGWSRQERCFKRVYREEYIPGNARTPGYVKTYKKRVRVPCDYHREPIPLYNEPINQNYGSVPVQPPVKQQSSNIDDNSCIEGSILGGIAGGGAGAALSRDDGRFWAIPLGIVGGALAGCQIDGG